jgi:hypothetical protein
MEAAIAAIIVALVSGPLMYMLNRLDKKANAAVAQNSAEHAENQAALLRIQETVSRVDTRLDEHISWHAHIQPTTQVVVNQPRKEAAA